MKSKYLSEVEKKIESEKQRYPHNIRDKNMKRSKYMNYDNSHVNKTNEIQIMIKYINDKFGFNIMNLHAIERVTKIFTEFTYDEIKIGVDESYNRYISFDEYSEIVPESFDKFINKISGICNNKRTAGIDNIVDRIKNLCRQKYHFDCRFLAEEKIINIMKILVEHGKNESEIDQYLNKVVYNCAYKTEYNKTGWKQFLENIEQIENELKENSFLNEITA